MLAAILLLAIPAAGAQQDHDPSRHRHHASTMNTETRTTSDARQIIEFPREMKEHTLANMRDHLLALQEIQTALSREEYDRAADIAENRLGMSSLGSHGAHEVSRFMPEGMRAAGSNMHRSASRFALASRDTSVTGNVKPALAALGEVTAACVACHAGYALK
jgi:hypothetical protein